MRIAATQYSAKYRAFEIYVSGCTIHCKGCHNPEIQSFEIGEHVDSAFVTKLLNKIGENRTMIDEVWILGGEPMDSSEEVFKLIETINIRFPDILLVLFTGYDIADIPSWCFSMFDVIKYGTYDETKKTEDRFLASSNQGVWMLRGMDRWKPLREGVD